MTKDLVDYIQTSQTYVNNTMIQVIDQSDFPSKLKKSMLYSIKAGGKRIRPILMFAAAEAFGGNKDDVLLTAIALELIHTYSLIHDDLPAMDDDDLRRGEPTNHIKFDEATAILAGDGLLTMAFQVIADAKELSPEQKVTIIKHLSNASGASGMIAGQILDLEAEEKQVTLSELEQIHHLKTGKLLVFAVEMGAYLAGASKSDLQIIKQFGQQIGLIFQIQDDILDVEGDQAQIGKRIGSDQDNEKSTYPKLLGIDGAIKAKEKNIEFAKKSLFDANISDTTLAHLVDYISNRDQ